MKIIHTSDWHLGQEFYAYDRTEEHTAFLTQLAQIAADEQPDVLVISGDIYHHATPSNSVMRLFTDRLDAVRRACPTMQIVVTAGNHDSPSRLEVARTLWEHLGVQVIGRIEKNGDEVDFSHLVLPVNNAQQQTVGYVVALPHLFLHAFPAVRPGLSSEERIPAFFAALGEYVDAVNVDQLPVVMMAHMAITGSDTTGHDEFRGGMEYLPVTDLKVPFDYLALGHIHCPQNIDGAPARYCGSPIAVNFDETYPHSVTVVDLQRHGEPPVCRTLPIHNPWPLLTIPATAVPFDEAMQVLADFPADRKAYLRLHVQLEDVAPHNALEQACRQVEGKCCRFCCFKWEHTTAAASAAPPYLDIDELKAQSPLEVAQLYYQNKFGNSMPDDLQDMLQEMLQIVSNPDQDGEPR